MHLLTCPPHHPEIQGCSPQIVTNKSTNLLVQNNFALKKLEVGLAGAVTPAKKLAYQSFMAFPESDRIAKELGRERRLTVINPDSDIPPKLANLFMNQPNKKRVL